MSWRDQMQKASFRGVSFYVTRSEGTLGQRTVTHEYPHRDDAFVEHMGLKARTFTLECFVIGDNYMAARNAFEAAVEVKSSGELVHPWRGRMTVSVTDCRASESIDQGGRQSWSVTFTQTGKNSQPSVRPDTVALVDVASDNAIAAVELDFSERFNVEKLPDFVEHDALTQLGEVLDLSLSSARAMLPDMTILPAFVSNAARVLAKASTLMRLPSSLANELTGQFNAVLGLASSPLAAFNTLKSFFNYPHQSVNRTTPARIAQDTNRAALADLTRRTAIVEAARSSASIEFESKNQAIAMRDVLVNAIEAEQLTASDDVFNALADVRTAVVADINSRATDLSKLIPYTPQATMPAVVLAYKLYADANRDAEIIARNQIAHPGFVQGGKPLEILV